MARTAVAVALDYREAEVAEVLEVVGTLDVYGVLVAVVLVGIFHMGEVQRGEAHLRHRHAPQVFFTRTPRIGTEEVNHLPPFRARRDDSCSSAVIFLPSVVSLNV